MKRIITIICLLAVPAILMGCTAREPSSGGMSLMERYHSGQPLISDPAVQSAQKDTEGKDLTTEQKQALDHFARGMSFMKQGRRELAFEQFSRAAQLDAELVMARYHRGILLLEQNMHSQAMADFTAVIEAQPDFAPAYLAAGRVYFANGLYPEAEKQFTRAIEKDSQLAEAHSYIGAIHNYHKDYPAAVNSFLQALAIKPTASHLFNNLGLTFSMMGEDAKAVDAFAKAIRFGAPTARAYNNMGLALCRLGRYNEALEAFMAAGTEATAWNNLGYFYFLDGQYNNAIVSFEKAIELQPTYYERAAENLKRARLAAQFDNRGSHGPARPETLAPQPQPAAVPAPKQGGLFSGSTPLSSAFSSGTGATNTDAPKPEIRQPLKQGGAAPERHISDSGRISGSNNTIVVEAETVTEQPEAVSTEELLQSVNKQARYRKPDNSQPEADTAKAQQPVVKQTKGNTVQSISPDFDSDAVNGFNDSENSDDTDEVPAAYTLHISSFRSTGRAQVEADRLTDLGLQPYIITVSVAGKGDWHRVTVGSYPTKEEARAARTTLTSSNGVLSGEKGLRLMKTHLFDPRMQAAHSDGEIGQAL